MKTLQIDRYSGSMESRYSTCSLLESSEAGKMFFAMRHAWRRSSPDSMTRVLYWKNAISISCPSGSLRTFQVQGYSDSVSRRYLHRLRPWFSNVRLEHVCVVSASPPGYHLWSGMGM